MRCIQTKPCIAAGLAVWSIVGTLHATPIGGLTVALSPDRSVLVAAGSNRTFYRLDPATLDVRERIWNGLSVTDMAFNRDGDVLAVTDAGMGGTVTLFDARTLQRKTDVQSCELATFATQADRFAGIEGHRRDATHLVVYNFGDGSQIVKAPITPKRPVVAVGMNREGTLAAVLYDGQNDPAEVKATPETSLRGLDRVVAQQKGDGRTAWVEFVEIPSGKRMAGHALFYVSSGTARAVVQDGVLVVVNYSNQNAAIGQDGSVRMFQCETSYNYGIGFSDDFATILTGGLAQLAVTATGDGTSRSYNVRERLPSWPEYFKGFTGHGDGPFYGATDGYRVLQFDRGGNIRLERPVY